MTRIELWLGRKAIFPLVFLMSSLTRHSLSALYRVMQGVGLGVCGYALVNDLDMSKMSSAILGWALVLFVGFALYVFHTRAEKPAIPSNFFRHFWTVMLIIELCRIAFFGSQLGLSMGWIIILLLAEYTALLDQGKRSLEKGA